MILDQIAGQNGAAPVERADPGLDGDVHHLIGHERDQQSDLVAGEGIHGRGRRPGLSATPVRFRAVGRGEA